MRAYALLPCAESSAKILALLSELRSKGFLVALATDSPRSVVERRGNDAVWQAMDAVVYAATPSVASAAHRHTPRDSAPPPPDVTPCSALSPVCAAAPQHLRRRARSEAGGRPLSRGRATATRRPDALPRL